MLYVFVHFRQQAHLRPWPLRPQTYESKYKKRLWCLFSSTLQTFLIHAFLTLGTDGIIFLRLILRPGFELTSVELHLLEEPFKDSQPIELQLPRQKLVELFYSRRPKNGSSPTFEKLIFDPKLRKQLLNDFVAKL